MLEIGCKFTSFGAHLTSLKVMSICIGEYEDSSSHVQLALERGLPAMIGNLLARQLPFPSLSFDMIHCTMCASNRNMIGNFEKKRKKRRGLLYVHCKTYNCSITFETGKKLLIEVNRLLKPGGYFVLPSLGNRMETKWNAKYLIEMMKELELCWKLRGLSTKPFVWQKSADADCYMSR